MLSQHDQVASVALSHQFGILESNALNDFSRVFKNIDRDDEYAGFVCMWSETDYVRFTGFNRMDLLGWKPRPKTVLAALTRLLGDYRDREGKAFWLQKCSPSQSQKLIDELGVSAKVINIRRPFNNILESSIALKQQTGVNSSFVRDLIVNAIQERFRLAISRRADTLTVDFESLKTDTESVVKEVCEFVGIEYSCSMLETPFEKNTSFNKKQRLYLSSFQKVLSFFIRSLFTVLPMKLVERIWVASRAKAPISIVRQTYHDLLKESNSAQPPLQHRVKEQDS